MIQNIRLIQKRFIPFSWVVLPIVLGVAVGVGAWVVDDLTTKWLVIVLMAIVAPTVVLLARDIHRLLLVVFVVDIPLGVDIALQNQGLHKGGPTGYMISLMTIALVAGYALWIIESKPTLRFFPAITIPALIYLGTVVVSVYHSSSLQLSLFGIFLEAQLFLYFLYLSNHVRKWGDLRLVMTTLAIVLLLESVLMLAQRFMGFSWDIGFLRSVDYVGSAGVSGARVGGTMDNPNTAAAFLSMALILTLGAYASGKLVNGKLALTAFGLGVLALIVTMSRSAWGSLALGLVIISYWFVRTPNGRKSLVALVVIVAVGAVALGGQVLERLQAAEADNSRSELAYMAYNIIAVYPFGVGVNNFDQVMSDRYAHPNWVGYPLEPVHNKYLLVWSELGPQGLAAFVLLLVSVAWQAKRYIFRKDIDPRLAILPASLLAGLAGYALHMTTEGFAARGNLELLWFAIALTPAVNEMIRQSLAGEKDAEGPLA
jgi:hypothetical protein